MPGCVGELLWCERRGLSVFTTLPGTPQSLKCVLTGQLWLAKVQGSSVKGCHRSGTVSRVYEESEQYG